MDHEASEPNIFTNLLISFTLGRESCCCLLSGLPHTRRDSEWAGMHRQDKRGKAFWSQELPPISTPHNLWLSCNENRVHEVSKAVNTSSTKDIMSCNKYLKYSVCYVLLNYVNTLSASYCYNTHYKETAKFH